MVPNLALMDLMGLLYSPAGLTLANLSSRSSLGTLTWSNLDSRTRLRSVQDTCSFSSFRSVGGSQDPAKLATNDCTCAILSLRLQILCDIGTTNGERIHTES